MKIALGADHGGFALKEVLAGHLRTLGHEVNDVGTASADPVDYPAYARAVATEVAEGRCERGIMIDGAGIGSAIVANKLRGIRAGLAYDLSSAVNGRVHNDTNVLTLGAGLIGPALAREIVEAWLAAACSEERHRRRVAQIEAIELAQAAELTPQDLMRITRRLNRLLEERAPAAATTATSAPGNPHAPATPGAPPAMPAPAGPAIATGDDELPRRADVPAPPRDLAALPETIARFIDHTLLKPEATADEIVRLCAEAREHGFYAVCINPAWVALARRELRGTPVVICAVVGFPLGAAHAETKALEARRAIREGAREIDMVVNIGALKAGDDARVLHDIRAVVEACRDGGALCKVILETGLLTDDEKRRACRLARTARAHFVKTSTGFGRGGATVEDVALMAGEVAASGMGVKAAGGIRSFADAQRMIAAGATRIGASAGVKILAEARQTRAAECGRGA
jgi:deoxyribose-phosphate aldolase